MNAKEKRMKMVKIIVRPDGIGTLIEYEESDDK